MFACVFQQKSVCIPSHFVVYVMFPTFRHEIAWCIQLCMTYNKQPTYLIEFFKENCGRYRSTLQQRKETLHFKKAMIEIIGAIALLSRRLQP